MPLVIADRVQETSTTAGTGTLTLAGAVTGYQSFSAIGNGNTTYYTIFDPTTGAWEVGLGTYTASGTTLSRTTVLSSSNAGALVSFAANIKSVFSTYPAGKAVYSDAAGNVGVGTNSPTAALEAYSNTSGSTIRATGDGFAATLNARRYDDSNVGPTLALTKYRGSFATPAAVQTGDNAGVVAFQGFGGANLRSLANIIGSVEAYVSDTDIATRLTFSTNSAGSITPTERMRISSNGNVAISEPISNSTDIFSINTISQLTTANQSQFSARATYSTNAITAQNDFYALGSGGDSGSPYTTANYYGFRATSYVLGTNQTLTNFFGFYCPAVSGATNSYGFYSAISANTGRYNFYAAGTARNYFAGNVESGGDILVTSPAGLGYGAGAGGTVTQVTSRTTGVTINEPSGAITLFSAAGSTTAASFTVTNNVVAVTDTIVLSQRTGANLYDLMVTAVAAGSFRITLRTTGGTTTEAPVINFTIIRGSVT